MKMWPLENRSDLEPNTTPTIVVLGRWPLPTHSHLFFSGPVGRGCGRKEEIQHATRTHPTHDTAQRSAITQANKVECQWLPIVGLHHCPRSICATG